MNVMNYKGYTARIDYDDEDAIFVAKLLGIRDSVTFHGESVDALKAAFHEAVDDYVATCAKIGKTPERAFSGNIMVRVDPQVHANAVLAAEASGKSLNKWTEDKLREAAERELQQA